MHRSMMQVHIKKSDEALEFYQKAFGAEILCRHVNQEDGTIAHAELDVFGQILALSELDDNEEITGNIMQLCLHFGDGKEDIIQKTYDILKDGANLIHPLGKCDFSPLMADLIDKFGVRWCIFV